MAARCQEVEPMYGTTLGWDEQVNIAPKYEWDGENPGGFGERMC